MENYKEQYDYVPPKRLPNIHLLKDYYRRPTFRDIERKGCDQSGTLRAQYVSLDYFIEYFTKSQVYAVMSRSERQILESEKSIMDFNKDLHSQIKQRKTELWRSKAGQLLTPSHFIRYGRNKQHH